MREVHPSGRPGSATSSCGTYTVRLAELRPDLVWPNVADTELVLRCWVLEKALYEVSYELNARPDWVDIPLRAILELLKDRNPMTTSADPTSRQAVSKPLECPPAELGDQDIYFFNEGTHSRLYEKLGAHCLPGGGGAFCPVGSQCATSLGHRRFQRLGTVRATRCGRLVCPASGKHLSPRHTPVRSTSITSSPKTNDYLVDKVDPFGFPTCNGAAQRVDRL